MEPFIQRNKAYFIIEEWMKKHKGLTAGFSTKKEGFSAGAITGLNLGFHVGDQQETVCRNRELLADSIGHPLNQWVGAEQTHEINIYKVSKEDSGKGSDRYDTSLPRTDGFITGEKDILLTLCFADCVPLFFIAPEEKLIGIAHAGWKGSVHAIGSEMVSALNKEGVPSHRIHVAIGPSICEKCYIVDENVITLVQNVLEDVEKKPYNQIREYEYQLDLRQLNKLILMGAGVAEEKILVTDYCTSCHSEKFYSHRKQRGQAGRMAGFIGWKEAL